MLLLNKCNKSKKMISLVAKIEYVSINSNWTQEIMAGRKKKLRYSEEIPNYNITLAGLESAIVTKRHLQVSHSSYLRQMEGLAGNSKSMYVSMYV